MRCAIRNSGCDTVTCACLQAAAVEAATVQAPSTYKKSEFELYTLTTWLLQARAAAQLVP